MKRIMPATYCNPNPGYLHHLLQNHRTLFRKLAFLMCIFTLAQSTQLFAQKEIWGSGGQYSNHVGEHRFGWIYKTNATGDNFSIVHNFDSINGRAPGGRLLHASNGKLYGITVSGGTGDITGQGGVLYEYNLEIDSFRVLVHFQFSPAMFDYPDASVGLIEVTPGILYGQVRTTTSVPAPKGKVFSYNINTNTLSLATDVPGFIGGTWNEPQNNYLAGPLFKAADGYLYSTTPRNSTCPGGSPDMGSIIRINPTNNTFTTLMLNPCSSVNGFKYQSSFIEYNSKLYSVAGGGLGSVYPSNMDGYGIIYEFNPANNNYSKKYEFQGGLLGEDPLPMIKAPNGKWYGTTQRGGDPYVSFGNPVPNGSGILFEYDPVTSTMVKKLNFQRTAADASDIGVGGQLWLQGSNGKLYGTTQNGIFEYDPATSQARPAARKSSLNSNPLIEICRKPAYKYYANIAFTLCQGTPFVHHLNTTNSTGIVWKRNGVIVPSQTNSTLEFTAITLADAGLWQAELTNECGTTFPPAIQITVNTANTGTVTSVITPGNTSICPGTTITLSGNNGGTWNTGATTSTIAVSQPGQFQVTNTNACGVTFSNIVIIDTIHIPRPMISVPNQMLCHGDSVVISSNVSGTWSNGATGTSITVLAQPNVPYHLVSQNQCRTDISNTLILPNYYFYTYEPSPIITYTGSLQLCSGQSVTLNSNNPMQPLSAYTWEWFRLLPSGNLQQVVNNVPSIQVSQAGSYLLRQRTPCGKYFYSDTIIVTVDNGLPATPLITASGPLVFCPGENVVLQSNVPGTWSTGETTASITVTASGTYFITASNACGQTVSNGTVVNVTTQAPLTSVNWTGTIAPICQTTTSFSLSGGSPAGGGYSGPGVTGANFNAVTAGPGTHTVTYTYTNGNGCTGTAVQSIQVEGPPVTPSIIYSLNGQSSGGNSITMCEGSNLLLLTIPFTDGGTWSNGSTDPFIYPQQSGVYSFTASNSCGTAAPTAGFTVTINPLPVISYVQDPDSICTGVSPLILGTATPAGGIYTGAGISGNQFSPTAAGTGVHTITYTYTDAQGCSANATQTITVIASPQTPVITASGPLEFCEGDQVVLLSSISDGLWSNGETGEEITVTTSGTYHITQQNICGTSVSGNVTVIVNPLPVVTYNQSPALVCNEEGTIPLSTATPAGGIFSGNGVSGNVFEPSLAGTGVHNITYTYTDANGCSASQEQEIQVNPIPSAPVITQNGHLLVSTQADTYQWFMNGTLLPGATSQTFNPAQDGTYSVVITIGGCQSSSLNFNYSTVGIKDNELQEKITLYPNPATNMVRLSGDIPVHALRILNQLGQEIMHVYQENEADVSELAPGTYFIEAETAHGTWRGKFVKR